MIAILSSLLLRTVPTFVFAENDRTPLNGLELDFLALKESQGSASLGVILLHQFCNLIIKLRFLH